MKEFSLKNLKDWEVTLIEKYPLIYKEGAADGECSLRYGFEFGQGWSELADEFSQVATQLVQHLRSTVQPDAFIHSCIYKSKFARMTWQGDDNLIDEPFNSLFSAYIQKIETKSTHVCEVTGNPGTVRNDIGWMTTLCDEEYQKMKNKLL